MSWPIFDFSAAPGYDQKADPNFSTPTYIGWSTPGAATSDAKWRIRKFTYSGSDLTDIQYADHDPGFTKVWDNRAKYKYGP